ncbi:response regulator transcription factor [Streptomyces sp. AC602_WCS936]|uniref:response regulator transcription factor n=1 Tax=Streptomyces sp. AC602_WCS936 TaxID=2823685 RepID=UPI0027E4BFB2|nr:response regulator transcription factor [Streptomyces sp. AC602_WCS936]
MLVVDSDPHDAAPLIRGLQRHGHRVTSVDTGAEALRAYREANLVLLDLDLPDLDGLEVCRTIRGADDTPVIALTTRDSELDRVLGLQAGADDYMAKPYGFRELMARIDAVMRRVSLAGERPADGVVTHGSLCIDTEAREVYVAGRHVELTRKEFDLLHLLASHPQDVVSRARIMQEVWGDSWSRRTVDTHVCNLRSKLGSTRWILTVRSVGFQLGAADRSGPDRP